MNTPKPGFKTRFMAWGLQLEASRRDALYARTSLLVKDYSQHRDINRLADDILAVTLSPHEVEFMYKAFDGILKKEYGCNIRARSVLSMGLKEALRARAAK